MTSRRSSILKPGRVREPFQELSQLLPNNDEEETIATVAGDNYKRRVSFANVNKVKEFEVNAECTALIHTPAYDQHFSVSSDSCQSSLYENYYNKSLFNSSTKIINDENVDVVEVKLLNLSKGAPSPGRTNAGDSSMEMTSVIPPQEASKYETETCNPLDLTNRFVAPRSPHQSINDETLESSSMETTEALSGLITEITRPDCDTEVEIQQGETSMEQTYVFDFMESPASSSHRMSKRSEIFLKERPTSKRSSAVIIDAGEHDVIIVKRRSMINDYNGNESNINSEQVIDEGRKSLLSQSSHDNQNIKTIVVREEKSTLISINDAQHIAEITQVNDVNVDVTYEEIFAENENKNPNQGERSVEVFSNEVETLVESCDKAKTANCIASNAETAINQSQEEIILCIEDIPKDQSPKTNILEVQQSPIKTDSENENNNVISTLDDKSVKHIAENISEPTTNIEEVLSPENRNEIEKEIPNPINNTATPTGGNSTSFELPTQIINAPKSPILNTSKNEEQGDITNDGDDSLTSSQTKFHDSQNTSSMIAECDFEDVMNNLKAVNLTTDLTMCIRQDGDESSNSEENKPSLEIAKNTLEEIVPVKESSVDNKQPIDDIVNPKVDDETFEYENPIKKRKPNESENEANIVNIEKEKRETAENIRKLLKCELSQWCIKSMTTREWIFDALWNRLQLKISFNDAKNCCTATLHFVPKAPTIIKDEVLRSKAAIGDNVLKIAVGPIIRKYKPKLDLLCSKTKDVLHLLQMFSSNIIFAEKFAENFANMIQLGDMQLSNGTITFYVSSFEKRVLVKIEVCMKILEKLSVSSINVTQVIGNVDENLIYDTFCKAGCDYDFFSKFVDGLWEQIDG